ncbi:hypothetical protein JCM10207_005166 [Rhodosporidiobolus poonsookiae]
MSDAPPHSAPAPYGPNVWDVPLPLPQGEMKLYHGVLPDFEVGSKRLEVRTAHIEYARVAYKRGWIVAGGAIFSDDSQSTMTGSWILFRALSLADARARLEQDIYATGGAWDMSRAELRCVAQAPLGAEGDAADFAKYLESAKKQ